MGHLKILMRSTFALACLLEVINAGETVLSTVLTPSQEDALSRQSRSYYDDRYGVGQYDRLEYERPTRCGRCDDRYDDRDDYDRPRDRYDDDRRIRPSNRFDKNKNYDDDDDRKVGSDRRSKSNGTDGGDDSDKKRPYDNEKRPSGGRRDRDRDRDRNRYDDRDGYRPDYYDRFLRDPYRERNYERPYYDDPYRRQSYDRYPDRYDDPYGSRLTGGYGGASYGGYSAYRRPVGGYDERYDRGNGYDDIYGGYGPSAGRGQHDSFRPWDETYRGQAGWDAGGRGYYFASGRPEAGAAAAWGRPEAGAAAAWGRPDYGSRPEVSSGWQSPGQRAPYGGAGYAPDAGYRPEPAAGYGRPSGWHSVGERRPYRDQSGVNALDTKGTYNQPSRHYSYGQGYGQANRGQTYGQSYGQSDDSQSNRGQHSPPSYGQGASYGQGSGYGQGANYGQATVGTSGYAQSSTTPGTSYLYQREDEQVTTKTTDETTKTPS